MSQRPAWTVIKHNFPNRTEVKHAPDPPVGLTYDIKYVNSINNVISLPLLYFQSTFVDAKIE